ncbi:MAG: 2-polyprenyl-3-methyl-5-hydroxy-6-metoxy-1,4-benzoquinol methylase [Glaciecola sp.]|jgi:2-polyprenyl-3-methyl-5-hydroxy-6-metoxy-1,4-benzoquinol methylase
MKSIGDLYNSLHGYHHKVSKNGGEVAYPIHKRFNDLSISETSEFQDINDWLLNYIDFTKVASLLDAGCGVGATSMAIAKQENCQVVGITLSEQELETANSFASKLNLSNCKFALQNMTAASKEKYDVIIAVESVKHVHDLKNTIHNLVDSLNEGGEIIIVEDFLSSEVAKLSYADKFKKYWMVKQIYSVADFEQEFNLKGLHKKEVIDFTDRVRKPSSMFLKLKFHVMNTLDYLLPIERVRSVLSIFLGGFILDYYYAKGQMKYKAIVYSKG